MYSIMIVDDEQEIRTGIIESVDWNSWGYHVVGEAENGKQAIEMIDKLHPDVVLTDIKMAEMDGVKLMQYLHEKYPEIKIVVLSGYNDFQYLNMSIKNQVSAYLLKPTDLGEFEQTFMELKENMDQLNLEKQERDQMDVSYKNSKDYIFQSIMGKLIHGDIADKEILKNDLESTGYVLNEEGFFLCIISMHHNSNYLLHMKIEDKNKLKNEIIVFMNEYVKIRNQNEAVFFLSPFKKITGVINLSFEHYKSFLEELQKNILNQFRVSISIGISEKCNKLEEISEHYAQARTVLYNQFYGGVICCYNDIKERKEKHIINDEILFPEEQFIINAMMKGNINDLKATVNHFFQNFSEEFLYNSEEIDVNVMKLLFLFSDSIEKIGIQFSELVKEKDLKFEKVFDIDSMIGKRNFILYVIEELNNRFIQRKYEKANDKLMKEIKEYIDQNYSSEVLSLDMVADHVKRSPAYISKIFKAGMGISFIQYVRKKRMEKSLELLQEGELFIYEVAYAVGYPDVSNFVKIFRKYYGITPTDYQKIFKGGE